VAAFAVLALGGCLTIGLARGRRSLFGVLALTAVLGAGSYVLNAEANTPPPFPPVAQRPAPPTPPRLEFDDVPVEVTEDGDAIRLVVPPERLAEMHARFRR
jgi:hypothetical protein